MDADFSHDPKHLSKLIEQSGHNNFVIGSRFCKGAKSDYKGLEKLFQSVEIYLLKQFLILN